MIFTFTQSYYISQLLTIDHYWQVPVDKHGSVKKNRLGQLFEFRNN